MRAAQKWAIFTLVAVAQFMVVLDTAIINVALPVMKTDLGFSATALQWVVTAYVLAFGGFLLLGGRVADLFGRRRTLLCGMAGFALFSLLVGVDSNPTLLIVLRGLQGASAAFMSPAALSIVLVTFGDDEHQRRRALGLWSMVATGGAAVGLLLGGVLTAYAGWRWNFFINIPIAVAVGLLVVRMVPAHETTESQRRLDLPGATLVTAGLMSAVLGLSQSATWGWSDPRTIAALAVAVVLITAFIDNERRVAQPLMPLSIFARRNTSGANLMMATVFAGNLAMFYVLTLYMQGVEGYSAVQTGLAFLPFPVVLGFTATRMAPFIRRFGFRPFLLGGPALVAVGMTWLCFLPTHGHYAPNILPALLIMPVGYGMSFPSIYAAATHGVEDRLAGVTSGLISASQQMGGAVGLAVVSGIAASVTGSLTQHSHDGALTTGYHAGLWGAVALNLIALTIGLIVVRTPRPAPTPDRRSETGSDRRRTVPS